MVRPPRFLYRQEMLPGTSFIFDLPHLGKCVDGVAIYHQLPLTNTFSQGIFRRGARYRDFNVYVVKSLPMFNCLGIRNV